MPSYDDAGRWIAEDHAWMERTREIAFQLWPDHRLSAESAPADHEYVSTADITLGTSALETSSWGECGNDDLPGDTSPDDRRSLHFDSAPLAQDLACFGYPTVRLNLECDKPLASLAIRLCEVSPDTGRSHLVTYGFYNLCYRDGDMARPQPVPPHPFVASIPLNIMGHVVKRGWRLRLAISPFYFPTLWPSPEIPTLKLHTGPVGDLPASVVWPRSIATEVRCQVRTAAAQRRSNPQRHLDRHGRFGALAMTTGACAPRFSAPGRVPSVATATCPVVARAAGGHCSAAIGVAPMIRPDRPRG